MKNKKTKAIDLFSGCGGTTLGLRKAGFNVIAGVENDPLAIETYQHNHPKVKVFASDIKELDAADVMAELCLVPGELDLLAGCPPCQGFSSIRIKNRVENYQDPRNNLVFKFLEWVEVFEPKVFMMENVPALKQDGRIKIILDRLQKKGYEGEPRLFDAAEYGVPQRRLRMIYIGSRIGPIPEPEKKAKSSVADAIAGLPEPGNSGDKLHDYPEKRTDAIKRKISLIPKNGGSRSSLPEEEQLECHKKCNGFQDIYGRMKWDDVAPTITSGCINPSKGRFLHPEANRAITLREAALLQSFPLDYWFSLKRGKGKAAQMIGNAFPPTFVSEHAHMCLKALRR